MIFKDMKKRIWYFELRTAENKLANSIAFKDWRQEEGSNDLLWFLQHKDNCISHALVLVSSSKIIYTT